jgi:hypothetical protein
MSDIHVYYIRDFQRRPVVTVALCDYDDDGTVCRGVSLCSELDAPVKSRGRDIAIGRMWKAYFHQEDSEPIRNMRRVPDVDGLFEIDEDGNERPVFEFKSGYDVEMTEYELSLMDDDFRKDEFDDEVDNREDVYYDVFDGCYKNL